ncbi:AAA family ATPase [Bacillus cereus]|uniref:AAA family ATPase n=1 Tax=Bacillus cereus TaxID=1396 RepID=UPI0012FB01B0|nr:AAA family ATPase [Bacillus cereus]
MENFETNFGSKYTFSFDGNKSIEIVDNDFFINDFFNMDDYSFLPGQLKISAIVGENGSGKSTILDFISEYMRVNSEEEEVQLNDYILIYLDKGKLYVDNRYAKNLNYQDRTRKGVKFLDNESYPDDHATLFFSNVFDVRYIGMVKEVDSVNYRNISTNALIGRGRNIDMFLNEEFEKQIFFIYEYKEELKVNQFMTIPNKIYLEVLRNFDNQLEYPFDLEIELFEIFENENVAAIYFNRVSKDKFVKNFYVNFLKCYFLNLYSLLEAFTSEPAFILINSFQYANKDLKSSIFEIIYAGIKEELLEIEEGNRYKIIIESVKKLNDKFQEFNEFLVNVNFKKEGNRVYIETNTSITEKFIFLYKEACADVKFLRFTWSEMSSGQYGLLNLFGRFYDALNKLKREYDTQREEFERYQVSDSFFEPTYPTSFLLLIDEGDLYFHPQWQKDWLFYFIRLVDILFTGRVQIILTTHSPFVLSDFPNTNVTFLSNEKNAITIDNDLDGSPRTFGANINDLFANSFFINDGLMGKFAKIKINNFIKELFRQTPEDVYLDKAYKEKFIDLIGEPLVKNKVMQVYREKLQLYSGNHIEERILNLEKELTRLKSMRKPND